MKEYVFPDIGEPRLPSATNSGDSYKMTIQDSTVSTKTDANYKQTRPRTTRMLRTWSYVFTALSNERHSILVDFFYKVGTFQSFKWKNWQDGKTYIVRFAEPLSLQEIYPYGWQGTLKFEEV